MRVRLNADIMKGAVVIRATASVPKKGSGSKTYTGHGSTDKAAIEALKIQIEEAAKIAEVRAQYPKFVDV